MFMAGDRNVYGGIAGGQPNTANNAYGDSPDPTAPATSNGAEVTFSTNPPTTGNGLGFSDKMHYEAGNVALCDGSVQGWTSSGFYNALNTTGDPNATSQNTGNVLMFP
jgi:prepilin-type processing-associated H-X9-DG protein